MPRPSILRRLSYALVTAILAGCAVGPDHARPSMSLPGEFARADASPTVGEGAVEGALPTPEADAEFWTTFDDPVLDRLVEAALAENHDLRIALARYDRANALLRNARFDRIPTITAGASAGDARTSAAELPGAARRDRDFEQYGASITASWELDVYGRVRRNVEAARTDTAANAADLAGLQVAIVAEVARTYMDLRGLQERLRVARENAQNQQETLQIVEARHSAGRGTEFDTSRARAQLETTLARLPAFEAAIAIDMHRLAVLSGRSPDALTGELEAASPLPRLPARLDPGTPGDLLRRRPDVIAAEHRLHAATARIGVATADLFPRFTLAGLVGTQAIDSSVLFERDSETRLVALGVDWSFLDIGRVRARIAAADADAAGALAGYEQAVLLALEDTENSLVRYARARVEDRHLEQAASDSARAAELARIRFDAGAVDLLEVLDAERTRLQAQDSFADGRTRSVTALVALYKSLAGGWPSRAPRQERVSAR